MLALRWLIALGLCTACTDPNKAQSQQPSQPQEERLWPLGNASRARTSWPRRIRDDARAIGMKLVEQSETSSADPTWASRSHIETLNKIESLLLEARNEAAALQEDHALTTLTRAAALAESLTPVPGAAAWIAEVYISLGLVAGQAGQTDLMETFLARAANFDPSRTIQAAEAAPTIVARAAQIARENAQKPLGTFWVHSTPEGANVAFDNIDMGPAPVRIRAFKGRHILRLHKKDFLSYGTMVDVLEGERPNLEVFLSAEPEFEFQETVRAATKAYDFEQIVAALQQHRSQSALWLMDSHHERALVTRCSAHGCSATIRLENASRPHDLSGWMSTAHTSTTFFQATVRQDRNWLYEHPSSNKPRPTPWWKRWYFWAGVGIAIAAAATGTALYALRPKPDQRLITTIDFGDMRP